MDDSDVPFLCNITPPSLQEEYGATICLESPPGSRPYCCSPQIPAAYSTIATLYCCVVAAVGMFGNLLTILALPYARRRNCAARAGSNGSSGSNQTRLSNSSDDLNSANPVLRSSATVLVLALSVADFAYCASNIPMFALQYAEGTWPYDVASCEFISFLRHLLAFASFASLAAIAVNRCVALWCPNVCKLLFGRRSTYGSIAVVWLFALGLCVPPTFQCYGKFGYNLQTGQCDVVPVDGRNSHELIVSIGCLLPFVIIIVSSVLVAFRVRKSGAALRELSDLGATTRAQIERRDMRLTRLFLLLCAVYFVCIGPIATTKVFNLKQRWSVGELIIYCLYWTHYAANFLIYAFRNSCYRRAYWLFLTDFRNWFCNSGRKIRQRIISSQVHQQSPVIPSISSTLTLVNTTT